MSALLSSTPAGADEIWADVGALAERYRLQASVGAVLLLLLLGAGFLLLLARNRALKGRIRQNETLEHSPQEAERRFRAAADALPSMTWTSAENSLRTFFNKAWLEFTGRTPEQEAGEGWTAGVHPDERDRCLSAYLEAFAARRSYTMEYRLLHADGDYRWIMDYGSPRFGPGPEPAFLGYAGYAVDITRHKRVQEELQADGEWLRTLVANVPGAVYRCATDPDRTVQYVSERIQAISGHPARDFTERGLGLGELIHPSDREWVAGELVKQPREDRIYALEYRIRDAGGNQHWVLDSGRIHATPESKAHWQDGVMFDISELRSSERELRQASVVFDSTTEGILLADGERRIVAVNQAFTEITGYGEAEIIGRDPRILASGRHDDAFFDDLWNSIHETSAWQGEIWNRRKNGEIHPLWETISAVRGPGGSVSGYVAIFSDLSHLRTAENQTEQPADQDPLTSLPSFIQFNARLQHAIHQAERHGEQLAVLLFDLDHFRRVNSALGHKAGDELLQAVAARLALRLRKSDTLSRRGGDEFTVLIERVSGPPEAGNLAQELLDQLSQPFTLASGGQVLTGASVGISLYPDDGADTDLLIRAADAAMYQAKDSGRGHARFHTREAAAIASRRLELAQRMEDALAGQRFRVVYQPLYAMTNGQVVGVEALLRWEDADMGEVPPARFIPIAEESGLIRNLGEWALRQACTQAAAWLKAGLELTVAVNVSDLQMKTAGFAEQVREILLDTGLPPENLELEMGESALDGDGGTNADNLIALSGLGAKIAVDDFVSDYSTLDYLRHLPVNRLKIDRSLVCELPSNEDDLKTVATLIALARSLRLHITAVGVETGEQRQLLHDQGCDTAQGYLYSPALEADAIPALLSGNAPMGENTAPAR